MSESNRIPGDRQHLERLIDVWVREGSGLGQSRLRRLLGFTAIAAMLDGLPGEDGRARLVIKGGGGLQLRLGARARTTSDLDTAFRGDIIEARDLLRSTLIRGWSGFEGVLSDEVEITRAGITPPPWRARIKLAYKSKPFSTVAFEMSAAEGASLDFPEYHRVAISLAPVQLPDPGKIAFLPARYQIAQKLHACTEPPTGDHPNTRVRDLYDILLIAELVELEEYPALSAACREIFELRGRHSWPPVFSEQPSWRETWRRLAEDRQVGLTFDQAFADVVDLIGRIETA